ncbi:MAG: ABC transporter ATP-binding protein [Planctomycetes bacterium]|nr:ABC transporter ATP-binding protein [Planctomycetota bacterium]
MLELKNVTKQYESPDGSERVTVLKRIDLKIEEGESVAITGPSGCGKSTLLNLIGALDIPTEGQVLFDGQDFAQLADAELASIRNGSIGFVFQLHHLLPQCTVLENVLVPTLAVKDADARALQSRARSLLERVGLQDFLNYRPAQLSGGQRQRVAVARALINQPRLLLADEPTGSLDQETAERIGGLLLEMHQSESVTLVVVTHSVSLAGQVGQTYCLERGRLLSETQA